MTDSIFEKLKTKWPITVAVALGSTISLCGIIYLVCSYSRPSRQPEPTLAPTPTAISSQGKIAFVRDGDIWVINPDKSGEEKIFGTDKAGVQNDAPRWLVWSPNDLELAFILFGGPPLKVTPQSGNVFRLNVNTKELTQLTHITGSLDNYYNSLSWSPNGQVLVSTHIQEDKSANRTLYWLEFFSVDGRLLGKITESDLSEDKKFNNLTLNGWFPDSVRVLLSCSEGLWQISLDGSEKRTLVNILPVYEYYYYPTRLSPDGRYIGYIRDGNVWTLNLETLRHEQRTTDGHLAVHSIDFNQKSYLQIEWSPNSKKIAATYFFRFDKEAGHPLTRGITLIDLEANSKEDVENITRDWIASLIWGSDSEKLIIETAGSRLLLLAHDGTLAELTKNASQSAWSPR